jgi:hypothetical protein
MKTILRGILFTLASLTSFGLQAQFSVAANTCFRTEILSSQSVGANCTKYQFKVTFEGDCRHALSHYSVAIPCGKVSNISNSENWKQVIGKDPKTGLTGFKIDDIPGFGDNSAVKSFLVSFTLCSDDKDCIESLKCWDPVVAYKAGTEIFYDTLDSKCDSHSLKGSIKASNATCFGATNGKAEVVIEDGVAPYTFNWSNGASTQFITNVGAGNYSVTVVDASGDSLVLGALLEQPEQILISGEITNASCNGVANGAVDATIEGGSGVYTFVWSNGTQTEDLSAINEGTYVLTVTDSSGCVAKKTFSVVSTSKILLSSKTVPAGCNQSNGSIDLTASGGTAPYTYVWSNGATTEDIGSLAAGVYKVKVTDASGCTAELVVNLKDNNTLRLAATMKQTSCVDDASGEINVTVSGGTAPYTFFWSNGATTEDLTQLIAGLYRLTVTDANGCTATIAVNISKKTFQVSSQIEHPLCYGDSTGSITLTPSGGTEPYTYEWSNGGTGNSIADLPGGVYQVIITDSTGCTKSMSYSVVKPSKIIASVSVTNNSCSGAGSTIDLSVTGGKQPYQYEWSNGETTQDIDSLSNGEYWVKITDANGCEILKQVLVESSPATWSCLINQLDSAIVCSSTNNQLTTSVESATNYSWTVNSSDGQWSITSGASSSAITYTAGSVGSSATFTLTLSKDGCTQTCSYAVTTCASDSTGGEDPGTGGEDPGSGGEDPGSGGETPGSGTESCADCFSTSIVKASSTGNCTTYEVTVSTDGNCRHELSHWDIAIPCGTLSDYSNSGGWKMVIGKDPTTGLYGLKVDGVDGFGKEVDSFTVKFTLCTEDAACKNKFTQWSPVVATKAGLCIAYDTLTLSSDENVRIGVKAYPNPFDDAVTFTWTADKDEYVSLDLIDKNGRKVKSVFEGFVTKGESYQVDWTTVSLSDDLYIYRYQAGSTVTYGKLFKR